MKNNFDIKKRLVLEGRSQIFKNWAEHSNITAEEFLENLKWVCDDPLDEKGLMTREIGLTPTGIVKLQRVNSTLLGFEGFYLDGMHWGGASFERQSTEAEKPFYGDTIKEWEKISLSCKDKI